MKLLSIASGSSGNCYYVGNDNTHLLVDAGISCKRVETALKDEGLKPSELYRPCKGNRRSGKKTWCAYIRHSRDHHGDEEHVISWKY